MTIIATRVDTIKALIKEMIDEHRKNPEFAIRVTWPPDVVDELKVRINVSAPPRVNADRWCTHEEWSVLVHFAQGPWLRIGDVPPAARARPVIAGEGW